MKGFKVYSINTIAGELAASGRRDLHTIYLLTGPRHLRCAHQQSELNGTYLCIGNPQGTGSPIPASTARQTGYGCLFTEEFVQESSPTGSPQPWTLLTGRYASTIPLCPQQAAYLTSLFEKMLTEQQSAYRFKDELLRSYLHLVLHEALRLRRPAPERCFQYYFRLPGSTGTLSSGWGSRRR